MMLKYTIYSLQHFNANVIKQQLETFLVYIDEKFSISALFYA